MCYWPKLYLGAGKTRKQLMLHTPKPWLDLVYYAPEHGMIFSPGPDITAYELARILQRVGALTNVETPARVASWPRELRRHWKSN